MKEFLNNRPFQISTIVLVLFSIVCTRIPLFNYLGFEFSVLTVLLAGYVSGILTLALWKRSDFECKADVWHFAGRTLSLQLILLGIPFLLSLANAMFVKNCSLGGGAVLYTLIVIPGVLFSVSIALFIGTVFKKWHKLLFTLLYILVLLHIPLVTVIRPQIFAFNPIIGFFPGFTYDETLQVTQRLITYRLSTLAVSGFIIVVSAWIWQIRSNGKEHSPDYQYSFSIIDITLLALLGPIVFVIFLFSDLLGISSSDEFIRQKLVGNYKTTHFEIIYPAGSVKRERVEQIGHLHEFYFEQLSRELNVHTQELISSFIYASPEQKGRLIGAANTDITKPWLRQMHINMSDVEMVLKHEMVHVLAAEFGWSPLKISKSSGLIEGLAVAMERTSMEEPLDRASALALAAGINPNLELMFTTGGFTQMNAGVSYTLAGSFCRSLIDSFGVEKFKQLYRTGDFTTIYRQDLKSLLMMWNHSIMKIPIGSEDSMKAAYYFRRPSIFGKECARVIANLNSETRNHIIRRDFDKAVISAERSLALSRTPEAINQKVTALFELQRFQDVVRFVEVKLHDSAINYVLLPLAIRLGDAYWAMDSLEQAKNIYEMMARIHLSSWYDEAYSLRLESLRNIQERKALKAFFIYSMEDTSRIARLERLASPIAKYLLAREYAAKARFAESVRVAESAGPMESKTLEFFRLHRLARDWFELQDFEKAKTAYMQSLKFAQNTYLRMKTEEWIERCDWMKISDVFH